MADRLLVIENGRVVQQGSPADVARPAGNPVRRPPCRPEPLHRHARPHDPNLSLDDGGTLTVTLNYDVDHPVESARAKEFSRRVLVGLRPLAITIHTARPEHASPRNVWKGTVSALELLADRVRVQVDATPPALVDISSAAVADLALRPGSGVWLSAKATETEAYPTPATTTAVTPPGMPMAADAERSTSTVAARSVGHDGEFRAA
jgi:molybdate transport system ATP-binding protein